jgi:hypothetical protein
MQLSSQQPVSAVPLRTDNTRSQRTLCDIIKSTHGGISNILPLEENNAWLWNIRE